MVYNFLFVPQFSGKRKMLWKEYTKTLSPYQLHTAFNGRVCVPPNYISISTAIEDGESKPNPLDYPSIWLLLRIKKYI